MSWTSSELSIASLQSISGVLAAVASATIGALGRMRKVEGEIEARLGYSNMLSERKHLTGTPPHVANSPHSVIRGGDMEQSPLHFPLEQSFHRHQVGPPTRHYNYFK